MPGPLGTGALCQTRASLGGTRAILKILSVKEPREGGCLLVWAPPGAKGVDGNPGSDPFLGSE